MNASVDSISTKSPQPAAQAEQKLNRFQEWLLSFQDDAQGDLDYMNDTSAAVLEKVPARSHRILWLLFAFIVVALIWSAFATVDEVTTGAGKIIPTSQIQVVQNLEGGIVSKILVREGERVEKGQIIIQIDDTRFASSYKEARAQMISLQLKLDRLLAEIDGSPLQMSIEDSDYPDLVKEELSLFQSRQTEFQTGLEILQQQYKQSEQELKALESQTRQLSNNYQLANRELQLTKPLIKEGAVSEVEVLRLQRQVNELNGQLQSARLNIPSLQAKVSEVASKLDEYRISFKVKAQDELNKVRAELSRMTESNVALEDRVTRTAVRAPMMGIVKQLKINTIGGVIQPGMDLVEIVPLDDSLLIEAKIRPKDIAFVHPGQKAKVKLTAYDFSIYGGLDAQLEHISADTITDENEESFYLIRVRTNQNKFIFQGDELPIIPGMTAEVDILTGEKSILSYLFKPIIKAKQRALRER